jgi:hypothetical protein
MSVVRSGQAPREAKSIGVVAHVLIVAEPRS